MQDTSAECYGRGAKWQIVKSTNCFLANADRTLKGAHKLAETQFAVTEAHFTFVSASIKCKHIDRSSTCIIGFLLQGPLGPGSSGPKAPGQSYPGGPDYHWAIFAVAPTRILFNCGAAYYQAWSNQLFTDGTEGRWGQAPYRVNTPRRSRVLSSRDNGADCNVFEKLLMIISAP